MLLHEPSITKTAFHVGRDPETSQLNLEKAGVEVHQQTKKIVGNNSEQTTVPHIFAIGDVLQVFDRTQIMMEKLVPSVLHLPLRPGARKRRYPGNEVDKTGTTISMSFYIQSIVTLPQQ